MPVPDFSPGEVLTAAAMDSIGLWLVKTQTVGAGVSSVTVTGAFSADYNAYKIIASDVTASGNGTAAFSLGGITTGWYGNLIYTDFVGGGVLKVGYNNVSAITHAGGTQSQILLLNLEIVNPFLTKAKFLRSHFGDNVNAGSVQAQNNQGTSATAFTVTAAAGTFTGGTISVYGFRK